MAEIKRIGNAPMGPQAHWTAWVHPNDVELDVLPRNVSIVYEIGRSDRDALPGPRVDLSEDVLYIGEGKRTIGTADSGRDIGRFKDLVLSWRDRNPRGPHDSYRSWEGMGADSQPAYEAIRIRYKALTSWKPLGWNDVRRFRGVDDVSGRELAYMKSQQGRRDRSSNEELARAGMILRPQTDVPFYEERKLIRSYEELYGRLPPLNGNGGDDDGPLVDDEWLESHLAGLERRNI